MRKAICFELPSDVPGLAWPESPGLGLALEGSGLVRPQARPYRRAWAWLGPGSGPGQGLFRPGLGPGLRAQARAYETKHEKHLNYTVFDLPLEAPHRDPQRTRSKSMRIYGIFDIPHGANAITFTCLYSVAATRLTASRLWQPRLFPFSAGPVQSRPQTNHGLG